MSLTPLRVVYEDNHLLIVNKPAGLPTMGVAPDRPSLLEVAREYLREKYRKPGNVYLGAVSRLDAPVSGLVVFARTSKAAARLSAQFRDREVDKIYLAIVSGRLPPSQAILENWVDKDERHRRMHIREQGGGSAQVARLSYRRLDLVEGRSLVEVRLETGRKHQIRLQLAHAGYPIVGDRKYGSREPFPVGIALHSWTLAVEHPTLRTLVELTVEPPAAWKNQGFDHRLNFS